MFSFVIKNSLKLLFFTWILVVSEEETTTSTTTPKPEKAPVKPEVRETLRKCFDELGCVEITDSFFNRTVRPNNVLPYDRYTIGTSFLLFSICGIDCHPNTYENLDDTEMIGYEDIWPSDKIVKLSRYTCGKDLKLIIHDFTSNAYTGWIKNLALVLLERNTSNVIAVNWQAGAQPPLIQAASNAMVVALEIGIMITTLTESFSLRLGQIHLIGHGLGAHVAGYVGKKIGGIGRITGLDPTGPYFEGMPDCVRLFKTDANYVEVLHTNADKHSKRSQGIRQASGHVDFYANDGGHQPGCHDNKNLTEVKYLTRNDISPDTIYPGCSHKRAFKYFIEACATKSCDFIGLQCPSYKDFKEGNCIGCTKSGSREIFCRKLSLADPYYSPDHHSVTVFLKTGPAKPYCRQMYQIKLRLSRCKEAKRTIHGFFDLIITGEDDHVTKASFNHGDFPTELIHGATHDFIAYGTNRRPFDIKSIKLKWTYTGKPMPIYSTAVYIDSIKIAYVQFPLKYVEPPNYIKFCARMFETNITEIRNGESVQFEKCMDLKDPRRPCGADN